MVRTLTLLVALVLSGCTDKPTSVSMVGDSLIAQLVGVQSFQVAPFNIAQNLGVSGKTTASILTTLADVSPSATHIIIEGGVNDFLAGSEGQIVANYLAMLQSIPSGKVAIVVGILDVDWPLLNSLRPDIAAKIDNVKIADTNTQLAALCRSFSNCRMSVRFGMAGKTADGMHLTAASYPAFIASIIPAL